MATRELAMPFAVDPLGRIAFVEDPNRQAAQHLELLLGTQVRTRPMYPDYGIDGYGYVFENDDEETIQRLSVEVDGAVANWSDVTVQDTVIETDDQGAINLTLYFSLLGTTDTALSPHTAKVQIGGTVVSIDD